MNRNEVYRKILYFYFQDYFYSLPKHERIKFSRPGIFGKLYNILVTLFLVLKESVQSTSHGRRDNPSLTRKHWVFVFGKNNYVSTKFLKGEGVVFVTERVRSFNESDKIIVLPYTRSLKSFLGFFNLVSFLKKMEGERAVEIFDLIFNSLGTYEAFDAIVKRHAPLSITFSNDHSVTPRALFFAAKANKVPTIYIQHATVTKDFPPLEFDLNLLEGMDAVDKYKAKGVQSEIKLIGMPRFDAFVHRRKISGSKYVQTIGMAFNTLDSTDIILNLVKEIVAAYPSIKIVIRKHQKDKRDFSSPFSSYSKNVSFSDALNEDPFDFILKCDLLLAGNSSIHLDARLLNVQSLFYDFDRVSKVLDLYGFIERGFVREITSVEGMIKELSVPGVTENIYMDAKYYNEAVGEPWEGKASDRAKEEIERLYSSLPQTHTNISP